MLRKSGKKRRGNGKPFTKGDPRAGRPKGSQNKATLQAKELCASIIHSETYLRKLTERADAGLLPPALESMLWHYVHGKPKETVEHTAKDGAGLSFTIKIDGNSDSNV